MTSEQVNHPQQPPAISDRPRTPAKYNSLARRRAPTSSNGVNRQNHTYERLEDLLREAGYKETRIFTPESKHKSKVPKLESACNPEAANTHPRRNSAVDTVVGFFTGFIPASTSGEGRGNSENQHRPVYESPPSFSGRSEPTSPSPTSKKRSLRSDLYAAKSELPHPTGRLPPPSREPSSHAHAYLRHMVSAPNIHNIHALRRTQCTRTASVGRRQMNPRSNTDPPLPQTWLQNVAKAVLFGGEGAHAGGPPPSDGAGPSAHGHSPLRSSRLNQSVLSNDAADPSTALGDSTNHVGYLRPPGVELMAGKVRVGRPSRSESQVSHTAVMCRSAPASRASSRARGGDTNQGKSYDHQLDIAAMMDRLVKDDLERQIRGRQWQSKTSKKKRTRDNVPSLARTHTTGDTWAAGPRRPLQRHTSMLSPKQRRGLGLSDDDFDEDQHLESDDSDDEGTELNLAQLLVPPKRQNSIRSLRKHLDSGVRHSYHAKQRQRAAETDVEEDTEDYLSWGTAGRRTLTKSRRPVIPGWQSGS